MALIGIEENFNLIVQKVFLSSLLYYNVLKHHSQVDNQVD